MFKKGPCLLAFLPFLVFSASSIQAAEMTVNICAPDMSSIIDVGKFISTGEVEMLEGKPYYQKVLPGPAPPPYPHVHVWDKAIEQLGSSSAEMEGVHFVNIGRWWVAKKWALVLWKIRIPEAALRMASEFEEDLTVALWADWNQDGKWGKNELMLHKNINLHHLFPTTAETVCVNYLTKFSVPEIQDYDGMGSTKWQNKDLRPIWVRCVLCYDDPDMSPDGEQLFGEVEDYHVTYMITSEGSVDQ
ncbi:MAG: hypothetical protein GTO51_02545 [Candidatus Latescibacteria bacterium]|nr:hypothetical protein [Candidatus Latescibacterota bacterium]NIM22561.1 hypothetical protein [Candidatus Latescibacterota bacterium]NIM64850.1 hypothetical protein [Candidatus Latescibacterota bacterium]NIO01365.1 hypothetical protein [Candidatus Latescibacterota bacterium]NIO27875.1 hypothetical protein [Candidatus Latescibacterota bacterium]